MLRLGTLPSQPRAVARLALRTHRALATERRRRKRAEAVLRRLLSCTELNLDELEPETEALVEEARGLVGC